MSSDMPYAQYSLLSKNEDVYDQIDRLQKWLKDFPEDFAAQLAIELGEISQKILSAAIEYCPKQSGALASSISLEGGVLEKSASGDFYEVSIYAGNDETFNFEGEPTSQYAMMVHDGHYDRAGKWVSPQPFLTDALDQYEGELDAIVDKVLTEMNANTQEG